MTQQVFRFSHTELSRITEDLGMQRPLLVAGHFRSLLPDTPVFSGFHPNPDFADCRAGLQMFLDQHCDSLIAIGGGSCIDTAKGILYLMLQEELPVPAFLAVPTTAGSGSEATDSAVVYVDGKKQSLQNPALKPSSVLLDPSLILSLPQHQLFSCAMDALCQAMESFWSKSHTEESRVFSEKAIHLLLPVIRDLALRSPELSLQQASSLLEGSYLAGQAIAITRTTACHAMSYMITKRFGLPHGQAVSLSMPYVMKEMLDSPDARASLELLAPLFCIENPDAFPEWFLGMLSCLNLLPDLSADDETLSFLTGSVNPERLSNHPMQLTRETIHTLYVRSLTKPGEEKLSACRSLFAAAVFSS